MSGWGEPDKRDEVVELVLELSANTGIYWRLHLIFAKLQN